MIVNVLCRIFTSRTLYKHKLLGKTNKLFEKAGIHYDKKRFKTLIESVMVYTKEQLTNNCTMEVYDSGNRKKLIER